MTCKVCKTPTNFPNYNYYKEYFNNHPPKHHTCPNHPTKTPNTLPTNPYNANPPTQNNISPPNVDSSTQSPNVKDDQNQKTLTDQPEIPLIQKTSKQTKPKQPLVLICTILLLTIITLALAYSLNSTTNIAPEAYHAELVDYALEIINKDRTEYGLQNVTLSPINSGQLHAEDMLQNNYFSHWNLAGHTPDMRYTTAEGKGAVTENIAYSNGLTNRDFFNKAKTTLEKLQYLMMYEDAEWDWGHRDNILNPLHTKVSIGIAYKDQHIYFVQNFENDYITWETLSISDTNQVTMIGTISKSDCTTQNILIFYSNPVPLTVNQLENPPYNGSYNPGTHVASVVPPARAGYYYNWSNYPVDGIEANHWNQNDNHFQISFSLNKTINNHGTGVYTLYLITSSNPAESLLTHSIWIT